MPAPNYTYRFNTGRQYDQFGQIINWVLIRKPKEDVVIFWDESRKITGTIPLFLGNLDLIDNNWVLRAYDDYHYRYPWPDEMPLARLAFKNTNYPF